MKKKSSPLLYNETSVKSLNWREHIRLRPGMYIGKLGDGSSAEDGIYVLVKEALDNAIDEHTMGYGKSIEVSVKGKRVSVRDYGRGIPLGKVVDCVSKINTGAKYDSAVFQKSVGLNGVGAKAINALSSYFKVQAFREAKCKVAEFKKGKLLKEYPVASSRERAGTAMVFEPDAALFKDYGFRAEYLEEMMWHYAFLNTGLSLHYNGKKFASQNGLRDLLAQKADTNAIHYPIIHLRGDDIEIALTHANRYGEEYYSFVNGQHTTQGGTHLAAFREGVVKAVRHFYKKDFDAPDIRTGLVAAVAVRIQEPVFESQTKTRLGSSHVAPGGATVRSFVGDFVARELEMYLHQHAPTAAALLKRIQESERERKEIAGIKKIANERARKANLHNKKLRDCRLHFNTPQKSSSAHRETMLFITEGDSASGSITKSRDVQTQAVFSLRGKPLNCFGLSKKVVYENEEFNLLQHALNIENGLEGLRYNKVVIATDADVDGMHIRLLLLTFFLRFFPELVKAGHVFILETPLFRVRNQKETHYCYNEQEKQQAAATLGGTPEITRFKGLGEISPEEFGFFIGDRIQLTPVTFQKDTRLTRLLQFYMGKNTPTRQEFVIDNLRIEVDPVEEAV